MNSTDSNLYINLTTLRINSYEAIVGTLGDFLCSNMGQLRISEFLDELISFEQSHNRNKEESLRLGCLLTYMLDRSHERSVLKHLAKLLSNRFKGLPYWAFKLRKGTATYIQLYVCERYYYPEGKEFFKKATSDRYFNKLTGKICKSDDPNAVLKYKKGQPTSKTETICFEPVKVDTFRFVNKEDFTNFMASLKQQLKNVLEMVVKVEFNEYLPIFKFNIDEAPLNQRNGRRYWNNYFHELEAKISDAIEDLKLSYSYTDESIEILRKFRNSINQRIRDGKFTYNKKFKGSFKFTNNRKILDDNKALFDHIFQDGFNMALREIYPIDSDFLVI